MFLDQLVSGVTFGLEMRFLGRNINKPLLEKRVFFFEFLYELVFAFELIFEFLIGNEDFRDFLLHFIEEEMLGGVFFIDSRLSVQPDILMNLSLNGPFGGVKMLNFGLALE
jgi:hypothetical protein